jgi:hypothetical protein
MQPLLKTKQADIGYIDPLLSFSERFVHLNLSVPDEGYSKKNISILIYMATSMDDTHQKNESYR